MPTHDNEPDINEMFPNGMPSSPMEFIKSDLVKDGIIFAIIGIGVNFVKDKIDEMAIE